MKIKVTFKGGPLDGQKKTLDGDPWEYRVVLPPDNITVTQKNKAPKRLQHNVEYVYRRYLTEPNIFWCTS